MIISLSVHNETGSIELELKSMDPWGTEKPASGSYRLSIQDGYTDPFECNLQAADVECVLRLIRTSRIHPFVSGKMGVDGVAYTLSFGANSAESSFSWWVDAGKGWGSLEKTAKALLDLGRKSRGRGYSIFGGIG